MSKSYSKIRHMRESNIILENRIINESATKNLYIKEEGEGVEPWMQGSNPSGSPKKPLDLSALKDSSQDNQPASIELKRFTFPFPDVFHRPGGIDGIYDKTNKKVSVEWDREKYDLIDKTKLEENPHNLTDFTWVKDLNEKFNTFNHNYLTPSYDVNNNNLVWVEISIDRKSNAKVVNTYPTRKTLPQ